MTEGDLPVGLRRDAASLGFVFFAAPDDIGLAVLGHEGVLEVLRALPRDDTVALLARVSALLNAIGEVNRTLQLRAVKAWLREPARARALCWLDEWPGGIIFTYEAAVRLTALAIEHADPHRQGMGEEDVARLLAVLPEVQAWLSRLDRWNAPDRERHSPNDREEMAFTLFLAVNAPGSSDSPRMMLDSFTLGAHAARHVRLSTKTERLAGERLLAQTGAELAEVHATAVHIANHFAFNPATLTAGAVPASFIDLETYESGPDRLSRVAAKMIAALTTSAPPQGAAITVPEVVGPKAALPERLRWHPMYQSTRNPHRLICWDLRTLHAMLGGRFDEWLKLLVAEAPDARDALGSAWDHAIEAGLDEMVRPILPNWSKPPQTGGTNCDRWFADGDHLFLVEVKNIRPGSALGTGSGHDFKNWLRSKFFKREGFPQILGTLRSLDQDDHKFRGRKFRRFKAIWPIVLCWTKVPAHALVTDLLHGLDDEQQRRVPPRLQSRLRRPLILDYDSFLWVLSCLPALRERGVGFGQLLEGYLHLRAERPLTLAQHAASMVPNSKPPAEMMAVLDAALGSVQAIRMRMKG